MPNITLSITTEKYNNFKIGFLKENPVPIDEAGNPTMNEGEWIKKCIIDQLLRFYKAGMKKIWEEQQGQLDDNLFT